MNRQKFYTGYGLLSAVLMVLLMFSSLPAMAKDYGLYIAGRQVTDANCNNLKDIKGVTVTADGEFKYDPAKNTLTMKNVTVSVGESQNAIQNKGIEGLTIVVSGTNRLETKRFSALSCLTSTKIEGNGSLTTVSKTVGVIINNTPLTISNITLEATGMCGIAGENGSNATLTLKNATVNAKGTEAAIAGFKTVTLEGCRIVAPAGAEWKAAEKAVVDAGGNRAKEVKIEPAAVKKYELFVAEVQVTDDNCDDLSGINGVTVAEGGEFKYDPTTKTLTMKGVTVSVGNDKNAIWNKSIEGLEIVISGSNRLEATDQSPLNCFASTKIEGSGSFTTTSKKNSGINIYETTLTISNITLEATGKRGIAGVAGGKDETLIIKNATVNAKGTEAAIAKLKTFTLEEGCQIITPEGGKFNEEKHAVVDAEGNVAKEVKIVPTTYELYIAGTQVTADNCNNLKDIKGVTVAPDGEFKYDPASNTLHIKDVTVSVKHVVKNAIYNKGVKDLKIVVSGTNRLESNIVVLYAAASIEIKGRGSLTVINNSNANIGIYLASSNTTVTISDISLEVSGKWGISGEPSVTNQALILKNARITASGTEAAIEDVTSFTTEGCEIVEPAGGKFDETKHAVVDAEGNKAKEVTIARTTYDLYIAGTQVTSDNCNNLKDIEGVTVAEGGEFKYDPASKMLTMKDVKVQVGNGKNAIFNRDIVGLKIVVSGTNSLETTDYPSLAIRVPTFIEGGGTLKTISASVSAGIYVNKTTLTISDITLEASGEWGITGSIGEMNSTLIIKNAKVSAKGTEAAIANLKTVTLEECRIVAPEGAEWKAEKKAVVDAEGNVAKEVKIERAAPVAVTGVKVTPTTVDLKVNETKQLTVTVEPNEATNKNYTCKSDKESVATVDKTGLVTAVGAGTATITITTADGGKTITCTVNVTESGTPTFALNPTTLNVPAAGGTPSVNVTSDKAWTLDYDNSVTWLKASPKAGTGAGTVTFTVEKNEASAPRTVVVTFKQAETEKVLQLTITQGTTASVHVPLQGISFTESALKLKVGTSVTLVVTYNPENATNKKVTWEVTEGAASLSVDANSGKITATNVAGTAKVKATSAEGSHTAECTITVTAEDVPVESISVSPAVLNLTVEGTEKLSVTVKPRTATNKTATWAVTAGADVVSVDGSGLVRALKEGSATITATVGSKTATCTVNVKAKDAPIAPLAVEDAVLASLVIAPNPFTSQLRIVNPEGIAVRYELVTLTGNVVRAGALDGTETMVDTEALPAGLYFVRFRTENSSERSVKVIKY